MAAVLVIAFSGSAAAVADNQGVTEQATALVTVTPAKCPSARRAVRFYASRLHEWRAKTGAASTPLPKKAKGCPRYLAHMLQRKAVQARRAYERWVDYHWAWQKWLPDKWQRIGACETGYGKRPGQWTWNSGAYQGAFGFARSTWDAYKPRGAPSEAYLATPRQQYQCALNVLADVGYGAWGCGGA